MNELLSWFEKSAPPSEQQMVVVSVLHVAGTGTANCQTEHLSQTVQQKYILFGLVLF